MFKFIQFCLTIAFLLSANFKPQTKPIEWEEIPLADLQMKTFPADSNASAVILCDFGESKLNDELGIEYNRHVRIKILTEAGYDWGTKSIYITESKYGERLDDLEAITYWLDENGEIVQAELDDDNIFEEEVTENRIKYTFTMPALKPGCIIDIRYKIIAESLWYIRGWTFQKDEPVLWSEYRITYPQNISFAAVTMGYEPWDISEYQELNQVFNGTAAGYLGNMVKCHSYRWAVKNSPAFRDEPYITTIDDYVNKIDLQLAAYAFVGIGEKRVLMDWETVVKELCDDSEFLGRVDVGEVDELTSKITAGLDSPEEKLKAIYDWITKSIVWSGEESFFPDYDVDEVIEFKKGNNADITFLLLSMLQSAGIECDPVILSTRSNGKIQDIYPIVSQFDYVLARVKIGGKNIFVDATDPLRPYDLPPVKVLNVRGLVIKPGKPEWVVLSSQKNNNDATVVNIVLHPDGSLKANFDGQYGEYEGLSMRKKISDQDEIGFVKEKYDAESVGFTVDSVSIMRKDSINSPLRIQAEISADNYTQVGGDLIYLNPNLLYRLNDNPFKLKDRKFPIDYAYPRTETTVINITLPPGYELKEKYEGKNFTVSSNASYKRGVAIENNIVQILTKTEIKQSEIKPNFYRQLKDFYARIIAAQSEMLVIGPVTEGNP